MGYGHHMGVLHYGGSDDPIYLDDRALAHLKIVITTKLRRNESFALSWRDAESHAVSTIWVHPSIPLRFTFEEIKSPELDLASVQALMDAANSSAGIALINNDSPHFGE